MFSLLLLWVVSGHCATLQFTAPSPDRPLALYRAPSPYREPGKARLSSFIITSKPFTIGEEPEQQLRSELRPVSSTTTRPKTSLHHISIDCSGGKVCSETISINSTPSPASKPYSPDVLEKFLNDYAAATKLKSNKHSKPEEPPSSTAKYISIAGVGASKKGSSEKGISDEVVPVEPTNRLANLYLDEDDPPDSQHEASSLGDGKSKIHWSIVPAKHHNHPYDDHDGWVTLEAIPWSTTKISKWQSSSSSLPSHSWDNNRPNRPPSTQLDWSQDKPGRPWDRPEYVPEKPLKPQYLSETRPWNDDRPNGDYEYKPSQSHGHWSSSSDIITDETPSKWPSSSSHRPLGSFKPWQSSGSDYAYYSESHHRPHYRPHSHPDNGDGEWILLSSTKGYSMPQRHQSYKRAITFSAKPVTSATRAVRLTVLPAINGSKNTTTSHGGMLEVESTFQTVDEAQRDDAMRKVGAQSDDSSGPQITTQYLTAPSRRGKSSAVLAAVGAGIVPATMGLIVPMVLGRKRRSVSFEPTTMVPVSIESPFLNQERN